MDGMKTQVTVTCRLKYRYIPIYSDHFTYSNVIIVNKQNEGVRYLSAWSAFVPSSIKYLHGKCSADSRCMNIYHPTYQMGIITLFTAAVDSAATSRLFIGREVLLKDTDKQFLRGYKAAISYPCRAIQNKH
jgi:hypothetical protein